MSIRKDNSIVANINAIESFSNKGDIRSFLLNQWIAETPNTHYRYFVETLKTGQRIYLERPGRLNKGCDFVIFIENQFTFKNGNDKPPKHTDFFEDLRQKKAYLTAKEYQCLMNAITAIYNCNSFDDAIQFTTGLAVIGLDYELIIKTLKWFFIEQDITYWAKSGRKMLYDTILAL